MRRIILISSILFQISFLTKINAWDTTAAKFYPLKTGNTYVFTNYDLAFSCAPTSILGTYRVMIGDIVLKPNSKYYYEFFGWWNLMGFRPPYWKYQRVDSNSMNVYAYDSTTNGEFLLDSLLGNVNTHFNCQRLNSTQPSGWFESSEQMSIFNALRIRRQFQCSAPIIAGTYYYLVEGIGFTGYSICEVGSGEEFRLKGCIINGVVFGDTTLTPINLINNIVPRQFSLSQNYPNPFNPKTIINYQLPVSGFVSLKVFDALGKGVTKLVNEKQNAGSYSVEFDADNLSSGIYFYKLETEGYTEIKGMVLLK